MLNTIMNLYEKSARRFGRYIPSGPKALINRTMQHLISSKLEHRLEMQDMSGFDVQDLRRRTLSFIENMRIKSQPYGQYRFSEAVSKATLYASTYAALTRHLYRDLDELSKEERRQWIDYILDHQADDGLFKDELVRNDVAEKLDGWGWRHLTLHSLMALTALGAVAPKKFKIIEPFKEPRFVVEWLESRNWAGNASDVSNEIQNYGVFLQYSRDFQGEEWAGTAIKKMLDWLDDAQDPKTGLWGTRFDTPALLSLGVQISYHIWLLYFYEGRPIRYMERIIDSCLLTQNRIGGFGVRLNSGACEDIDSIDPLVRFSYCTQYRGADIKLALRRALPWVIINSNEDGGFVFSRELPYTAFHELLHSGANQSGMFPTWFRALSLAYIANALPDSPIAKFDWQFIDSPGHQFWRW
jgi:hypothetical protein